MNTHTTAPKAKIRHLCSCLVLCLHLACGAVPGPCEHSVTEEHLQTLGKLILNQVQNGCSINYWFTKRQNLVCKFIFRFHILCSKFKKCKTLRLISDQIYQTIVQMHALREEIRPEEHLTFCTKQLTWSEVCYIKAAFSHILDLLNTHFTYEKGSDNYQYTSSLKDLIYNIYSEKCIPPINEEIEENTETFARLYTSLPREGLQKAKEVFQMYKRLMSNNDKPVNWNCEEEYANNLPESTTALHTETTDTPECQCSCPHHLKAFMVTRSNPTASPVSPHTQSEAYIFRKKNEGSRASEPAVKDEAPNSTQNQISTISQGPDSFSGLYPKTELFTEQQSASIHADSTNFITSTAANLLDYSLDTSVEIRSEPQSVTSSPIASSSELLSIPTRTLLQSVTSQPSEKISTPLISDRNPVLKLAKMSLDTREQGMLSDSYSKLLQSWVTETTGISKNKKVKLLEITPGVVENSPAEHVEQNTSRHLQKSLPKNVFKIISKEPDCKDSRCQNGTDMRSRNRVKRHSGEKEYQLTHMYMYTMFLITSACSLLLFITVLFYCKQHRIKDLQKEDRTIHF